MNKRIILTIVGVISAVAFAGFVDEAFAAEGGGSGGSSWNNNGCYSARTSQNVSQCPDEYGVGGGASWHVFKVSNTPVFDNTSNEPASGRPIVRYGVVGHGYPDKWGRTVEKMCKGFDYYFAYVYDGWWGVQNWYNTKYWGPIAWGEYADEYGGVIHRPIYHNADYNRLHPNAKRDYTWDQVNAQLIRRRSGQSSQDMNGWRIQGENPLSTYENNYKSYEALKAYRVFSGQPNAAKIPDGVGFFCAGARQYTLTVKSIDTNGRSLAKVPGLGDVSKVADMGTVASVSHGNTSAGFTFQYWRSASGANVGTGSTYSINSGTDVVVYAVYKAFSATSSLDIKQKKSTAGSYQDGVIYAKPNDEINYQISYNPSAQGAYTLRPQRISVNGGGSWGISTTLGQALSGWSNSFRVDSAKFVANYSSMPNYSYSNGNTTSRTERNNHKVLTTEVGREMSETAQLRNDSAKTPKTVQIDLEGDGYSVGRVYTGLSDTVYTRVPYNFTNDPGKPKKPGEPSNNPGDDGNDPRDGNGNEKIVYAGEEDNFEFVVNVNPRYNPETDGNYATVVDNAKWRLGLCYGGMCDTGTYNYTKEEVGQLNSKYKMEGDSDTIPLKINIPDIKAGSRICVVAEVFPRTSGAYTNWNDTNYDGTWARSPKACYIVAKRPSTQIWGGNVYSRGNLITGTAIKNNLNGYSEYTYDATKKKGTFVFGSWGELGVVANGSVQGFGSGASMGYNRNDGGNVTWPNHTYKAGDNTTFNYYGAGNTAAGGAPGGSGKENYCDRAPLTIPNEGCTRTGSTMGLSTSVGATQAANDKKSIIDVLGLSGTEFSGELNSTVVGPSIAGNETKTFGTKDGDITITSDLVYFDTGDLYRSYRDMPKLIIYAKNIKINCNVERIDALLIADNEVNTCANSNNINNRDNSRQLFVNGAIIANRMVANRTYGAATGANSIVPAEIINFDPTLYEFGNSAIIDDDVASRLDATYIHELAPRL